MKTWICLLGVLGLTITLTACNSSSSKEGTGGGTIPPVTFEVQEGTDKVICFNADKNVNTGSFQTCEWNCGSYQLSPPANWVIQFDLDPQLRDPNSTADYTYNVVRVGPCK